MFRRKLLEIVRVITACLHNIERISLIERHLALLDFHLVNLSGNLAMLNAFIINIDIHTTQCCIRLTTPRVSSNDTSVVGPGQELWLRVRFEFLCCFYLPRWGWPILADGTDWRSGKQRSLYSSAVHVALASCPGKMRE